MVPLHPQLEKDTVPVAVWPLCRVLLMNDSTYPWLILVPQRDDLREMHDLPPPDRNRLMQEMALASSLLQAATGAEKMNVAALGNMVPQLHIHVIARFSTDPAWPRPVWGAVPATPYTPEALEAMLTRLRTALTPPRPPLA
ncbi:HIT domain-containing protein [Novispirillum itersonii]|uniref:HIT domain-containing protein n=1 Tax=Novispirillum itersonii TaxID=189 RepID=UPI00036BD51C|nr:HIT domain-containing protein [Novispirillum itersonii]